MTFLSTSPLRGTTRAGGRGGKHPHISIHVPLAGDDAKGQAAQSGFRAFLSTSPLRGTTGGGTDERVKDIFLSTSPLRGTTCSSAPTAAMA